MIIGRLSILPLIKSVPEEEGSYFRNKGAIHILHLGYIMAE